MKLKGLDQYCIHKKFFLFLMNAFNGNDSFISLCILIKTPHRWFLFITVQRVSVIRSRDIHNPR